MENSYGIGIANRYELFYDQDDVTDFEQVITKKKEKKSKEPAQQTQAPSPAVQQKSAAEKENKQVKKAPLDNGTGQKATPDQQRRGIKEQSNNSNKDNSTARKDGGEFSQSVSFFGKFLVKFSAPHVVQIAASVCVREYVSHRVKTA